jgi:dTDP-4-amino-4,6-dideoxygalactose transaminase
MLVPFYKCAREYAEHKEQILKITDEVLSSGQVLQGHWVEDFEKALASFVRRAYAVAVGSCTDALFFALKALGIGEGDKVLVPNFTFPASATCILRAKAIPVFVDVNENGNMDLKQAEKYAKDAKAMIYVHLYGQMETQSLIRRFASHYNLKVIEDAAQALGSAHDKVKAGSIGEMACFSFDPTKPLSAPGSGGAVVTNSLRYRDTIEALRYHGKVDQDFHCLGYNSQMPSITAAILSYKLKLLDNQQYERMEYIAGHYNRQLDYFLELPLWDRGFNYHKYVVRTDRRPDLKLYLEDLGVETKIHYQTPLSAMPVFSGYGRDKYPNSFRLAKTVLSLPCHSYLTHDEVSLVIQGIRNFFKGK